MKTGKGSTMLMILLGLAVVGFFAVTAMAEGDAPRITKEQLQELLGNPDVIVLDVRFSSNWQESELTIKGATREMPAAFHSWANKYPKEKTLVLY